MDHVIAGGQIRGAAPNQSMAVGKADLQMGKTGGVLMHQMHGKYYEAAVRGKLFSVANQAAVSTTAALATTWTGLAIDNPAGSGFNLVIAKFGMAQFTVTVAGKVGLMTGAGLAAGSLAVKSALDSANAASSVAGASAGATIATPVLQRLFFSIGSLATSGYGIQGPNEVDLEGSLIIPPGRFLATYTTAATTTDLAFHLVWEEVPIL